MLATLRDTLTSLAASYPTRAADDELLLGMASLTHPRLRSAVHVRMREQQLMHNAATLIDALEVRHLRRLPSRFCRAPVRRVVAPRLTAGFAPSVHATGEAG
jgi:hypothetical protein